MNQTKTAIAHVQRQWVEGEQGVTPIQMGLKYRAKRQRQQWLHTYTRPMAGPDKPAA